MFKFLLAFGLLFAETSVPEDISVPEPETSEEVSVPEETPSETPSEEEEKEETPVKTPEEVLDGILSNFVEDAEERNKIMTIFSMIGSALASLIGAMIYNAVRHKNDIVVSESIKRNAKDIEKLTKDVNDIKEVLEALASKTNTAVDKLTLEPLDHKITGMLGILQTLSKEDFDNE